MITSFQQSAPRPSGWAAYAARMPKTGTSARMNSSTSDYAGGSPGSPSDFNPPTYPGGTFDPYPPSAMPTTTGGGTGLGPAFRPNPYPAIGAPGYDPFHGDQIPAGSFLGSNPWNPTLPTLQAPSERPFPAEWTTSPDNAATGGVGIGGGSVGGVSTLPRFDPSNPGRGGMDSNGNWHDPSGQNFDAASWLASHLGGNTNYTGSGNAPPARVSDAGATIFGSAHYIDENGIIRASTPQNLAMYPKGTGIGGGALRGG